MLKTTAETRGQLEHTIPEKTINNNLNAFSSHLGVQWTKQARRQTTIVRQEHATRQ